MPNEYKHEARPKTATSEDEHSAINREDNQPKAIQ